MAENLYAAIPARRKGEPLITLPQTFISDTNSEVFMKLVYGVGINDAGYTVRPGGRGNTEICPVYLAWSNMLKRAYSKSYHLKNHTYLGVTVCEEWHRFSNFKRWYDEHHVDGWHLDKDLLTDSREYGPSTCVFVPGWLNRFALNSQSVRGEWPIGVYWHKGADKFAAHCNNNITRKTEHLGLFSSKEEAHIAWLNRKMELAYQLKDLMDAIDRRIYFRVTEVIMRAV